LIKTTIYISVFQSGFRGTHRFLQNIFGFRQIFKVRLGYVHTRARQRIAIFGAFSYQFLNLNKKFAISIT
jgi:hypothetical protein